MACECCPLQFILSFRFPTELWYFQDRPQEETVWTNALNSLCDCKSSLPFQTTVASVFEVKTFGSFQAALYTSQLLGSHISYAHTSYSHVQVHGTRSAAARAVKSALNSNGYSKPQKADCVSALGSFLLSDSQKITYHFVSEAPNHNIHLFYKVLRHRDENTCDGLSYANSLPVTWNEWSSQNMIKYQFWILFLIRTSSDTSSEEYRKI